MPYTIATPQQQVSYQDLLRVWLEADQMPEVEGAWLFDHLMPIGGDPDGPMLEGWTLLSALAAQTSRLRLGLLVSSNRFRPPAVLAKIATTVDIVSGGRLDFGIGVGSRPQHPLARREYAAHGLPFVDTADAIASFAEAVPLIKRLWTDPAPFDVKCRHHRLTSAFGNPKPLQRPYPPIMIGGAAPTTLRVAAAHADLWNTPGPDLDGQGLEEVRRPNALLDRYCTELGRDSAEIVRSVTLQISYAAPDRTRAMVAAVAEAGFGHVVLGLPAPYPEGVARWVAEAIVEDA